VHIVDDTDPVLLATTPISDAAAKMAKAESDIEVLTKRLDEMDAKIGDIKSGYFADLERLAKSNAETVEYWQRHHERLAKI
jgi:hypothetical protein